MELIFGSQALKHWFPDFPRDSKDLDIIAKGKKSTKEVEYHWVDSFQYILDNNKDSKYVDPNFLYTAKVSHAAWDVWWDKTMHHIMFLKAKGCQLDRTLYNMLINEWKIVHGAKKVKVVGKGEEFFNSNIVRKYNHDDLHELVKFYDKPMHELIRPNKDDVKVSIDLWNKLQYNDQLKCALEETYVFALERYYELPPKIAFYKALKQLITSSTKGFFNLFLIENYKELMDYDRTDYVKNYKLLKEL